MGTPKTKKSGKVGRKSELATPSLAMPTLVATPSPTLVAPVPVHNTAAVASPSVSSTVTAPQLLLKVEFIFNHSFIIAPQSKLRAIRVEDLLNLLKTTSFAYWVCMPVKQYCLLCMHASIMDAFHIQTNSVNTHNLCSFTFNIVQNAKTYVTVPRCPFLKSLLCVWALTVLSPYCAKNNVWCLYLVTRVCAGSSWSEETSRHHHPIYRAAKS